MMADPPIDIRVNRTPLTRPREDADPIPRVTVQWLSDSTSLGITVVPELFWVRTFRPALLAGFALNAVPYTLHDETT